MQLLCSICTSLFETTDAVVGTHCGHLFHHHCMTQWVERSNSCPQCRTKSHEKNRFRIYFNTHSGPTQDPSTLQTKIDSLEFNLLLKGNELKKCDEEMTTYKKQSDALKKEVKHLKGEVKAAEYNSCILKEKCNVMKRQIEELEPMQRECERLRNEIKFMRNIETVLTGSSEEVEHMLDDYQDTNSVKSLLTFTSILKREVQSLGRKKKELNTKLRASESKIFALKSQLKETEMMLTAEIERNSNLMKTSERDTQEHTSLKRKIEALEQAIASPSASDPCTSALKRLLAESPAPASLKGATLADILDGGSVISPDPLPASAKDGSPFLKITSSSVGLTPLRPYKIRISQQENKSNYQGSSSSIFKKPRMNTYQAISALSERQDYDGYGGNSKPDVFPRRIPQIRIKPPNKPKTMKKIKVKDAVGSSKIEDFFQK